MNIDEQRLRGYLQEQHIQAEHLSLELVLENRGAILRIRK